MKEEILAITMLAIVEDDDCPAWVKQAIHNAFYKVSERPDGEKS